MGCLFQTAESVAESVLNLASSDSVVMVTVDSADEPMEGAMSSHTDAMVVVHNPDIAIPPPHIPNMPPLDRGATAAIPPMPFSGQPLDLNQVNMLAEEGAEGGSPTNKDVPTPLGMGPGSRKNSRLEGKKVEGASSRATPTNPMSVSVPNLTSNMEQTVSLLESFAAVARRNLGNNGNPMGRSNNASSLVRLALSSNANG